MIWEAPKQFDGVCEEVMILKRALGKAAKQRDVARVLDLVQAVLGGEHFCDIGVILELGAIDCDGLAAFRAAELRQAGIQARAFMTSRERAGGGTTYHALVRWPSLGPDSPDHGMETDEDPSLLLGMSQPDRAADRQEEIRKNIERCDYLRGRRALPGGRSGNANLDALLEGVFGVRPRRARAELSPDIEEIERMLGGRAA